LFVKSADEAVETRVADAVVDRNFH
jgi:hypothetical protein